MNESQVRELLRLAASDVATTPLDGETLIASSTRLAPRRRAVPVLLAAAVVVALGAAALTLGKVSSDVHRQSARPTTTVRTSPDSGLLPPPGTRFVAISGLAFAVPSKWATNAGRCGTAMTDTVMFGGDVRDCLQLPMPDVSALHLTRMSDSAAQEWVRRPGVRQRLNGISVKRVATRLNHALCTTGRCDLFTGALVVPERRVVMWVSSPRQTTVDEVLGSMQPVPAQYATVPNLTGQPAAKATDALRSLGLRAVSLPSCAGWADSVVRMCSDRVMRTDPSQGSVVHLGSTVGLGSSPSRFSPTTQLLSQRRLKLTVSGSSSCPYRAGSVDTGPGNRIVVHMSPAGHVVCTADLVPTSTVVPLPESVHMRSKVSLTAMVSGTAYTAVLRPRDTGPDPGVPGRYRRLVHAFYEFARAPSSAAAEVPLTGSSVQLARGPVIVGAVMRRDYADPKAWEVSLRWFRGLTGKTSALQLLASSRGRYHISVGPHATCVGPVAPVARNLRGLRRIAVQPAHVGSCIDWWSVDLFIDPRSHHVLAVSLDLWEP